MQDKYTNNIPFLTPEARRVKFPLLLGRYLFSNYPAVKLYIALQIYAAGKIRFSKNQVKFFTEKLQCSKRTLFRNIRKLERLGWINKNPRSGIWFVHSMRNVMNSMNIEKKTTVTVYSEDLPMLKQLLIAGTIKYLQRRNIFLFKNRNKLSYKARSKKDLTNKAKYGSFYVIPQQSIAGLLKIDRTTVVKLVKNNRYLTFRRNSQLARIKTKDIPGLIAGRYNEEFFRIRKWEPVTSVIAFIQPHFYQVGYKVELSKIRKK